MTSAAVSVNTGGAGTREFFGLFGLAPAFAVDVVALDKRYRQIQTEVHPDRHAHLGETERRLAMQWSVLANEAYRTLKDPIERAVYLLRLNDIDVMGSDRTALPPAFLLEQMEWHEIIDEAQVNGDHGALEELEGRFEAAIGDLSRQLTMALDHEKDFAGAVEMVQKMQFLHKLSLQVGDAMEALV